ncbi:MAG: hypothetical protein JXR94_18015 [Candidatus Hydrogenedentes bacterium]|nr:hypothetical protein [Candidatus Hydrogenedentota bacterium]
MAIALGSVTFDEAYTTVREKQEEVGGRDERLIELSGLIHGESTLAGIEARLDAIVDAASAADYGAALCLRPGRRLWVRRESFAREIRRDAQVGAFTLTLRARDRFEESIEPTEIAWAIAASGATTAVCSAGNADAAPVLALEADGDLVNPAFSDGARTIAYAGVVADGSTLEFDGEAGQVRLDGEDVTPYSTGAFPRIAPEGTTLVYTDDAASSHTAAVAIAFRDRWW